MKPKPQDWKTGLKKLNEIHFGKPMKHQDDWENEFDEMLWKLLCKLRLSGNTESAIKESIKQFIFKLLDEKGEKYMHSWEVMNKVNHDNAIKAIQENREEIKSDLLKIADSYECEELRLAVEGYFSVIK